MNDYITKCQECGLTDQKTKRSICDSCEEEMKRPIGTTMIFISTVIVVFSAIVENNLINLLAGMYIGTFFTYLLMKSKENDKDNT